MNAHVLQFADGLRAVFLDDIRYGDNADKLTAPAEIQRGFAGLREGFGLFFKICGDICLRGDELQVAACENFAVQGSGEAIAGLCHEVCDFFCLHADLLSARHDGFGERVLALFLKRTCGFQKVFFGDARGG